MATYKRPSRTFHGADAEMLVRAQLHHDLFVRYMSDFTAFNVAYDGAFAREWQSAVDRAWRMLATKYRTPLETARLVMCLNAAWAFSQQIAAAGKLIYRNTDPACYSMFLLGR